MIHFVNITETEFLSKKLVYKHMSLENALKTLETKTLWFANPENWKDPFEKRFLNARYLSKGIETPLDWKGRLFCTCVTQTVSSEAFWHAYSHNDIGVEFRIDRAVLLEELKKYASIYDIFIGKVEYMKTKDIEQNLKDIPFDPPTYVDIHSNIFVSRLLLLKRIAFSYENELRIILLKKEASTENGIELKYDCRNTELIRKILLDPEIKNYTYKALKSILVSKYGFSSTMTGTKRKARVFRSHLYEPTETETILID